MSLYPGICVPGPAPAALASASALLRACPKGSHFEAREPGSHPSARSAAISAQRTTVTTHYFTGVDVPLTPAFSAALIDQPQLDAIWKIDHMRCRFDAYGLPLLEVGRVITAVGSYHHGNHTCDQPKLKYQRIFLDPDDLYHRVGLVDPVDVN